MSIPESLAKRIEELNSIIKDAQSELNRLRTVYSKFSNLQVKYDRWRYARYFTSEANSIVNDVDIQHTCGMVVVRPLIIVNQFNIFSDPIDFYIGDDSNSYHAYDFHDDWEAQFIKYNINKIVIEKVRAYILKYTAIDDESDDDYTNQGTE